MVQGFGNFPVCVQRTGRLETRDRTFSDSALLYTRSEHTLAEFYKIVLDLLEFPKGQSKLYCIINRDEETAVPNHSSIGGYTVNSNNKPHYNRVVGSGPAWVNIYLADLAIKEKQKWHDKYTLYCVGKGNIVAELFSSSDSIIINGFSEKEVEIHALVSQKLGKNNL